MGAHLIDGEFQSDKYPWCKRGFAPLKLTDRGAWAVLWAYAQQRRSVDAVFADDLQEALRLKGYDGPTDVTSLVAAITLYTQALEDEGTARRLAEAGL